LEIEYSKEKLGKRIEEREVGKQERGDMREGHKILA